MFFEQSINTIKGQKPKLNREEDKKTYMFLLFRVERSEDHLHYSLSTVRDRK
jgi:hypothetical protein